MSHLPAQNLSVLFRRRPKAESSATPRGDSWWVGLDRAALTTEAYRRHGGDLEPPLLELATRGDFKGRGWA
jgi:hypothetical protein